MVAWPAVDGQILTFGPEQLAANVDAISPIRRGLIGEIFFDQIGVDGECRFGPFRRSDDDPLNRT